MEIKSMSATQSLADMALGVRLESLPGEAVKQAKRILIDSLACMLGGFHSPTGIACRQAAHDMGGPAEATLVGEPTRVSARSAVIANQGMLRFLDYNDDIEIPIGTGDIVSAHPSGSLPVAMAAAEMTNASGSQFLEAMIAGYETIGRVLESLKISLEVRGFHHAVVLSYAGAAMSGKLFGLTSSQLVQAMGIAGSVALSLGILDAEGEEYVMTKNIVDGMCAERGLVGAILARRGLTGPERILEGNKGFAQVVLGGADKFVLKPRRDRPFILDTVTKYICAEATTHGHLTATQAIMSANRLRADDVDRVVIRTNARTVFHTGDPIKKYPRNKESADHSSYFLAAMMILEGRISPNTYTPENYSSPTVRAMIDRIDLVHGPEFDFKIGGAEVEIYTKQGELFRKTIWPDELKGSAARPMDDNDIREKFLICTDGLLKSAQVDRIIDCCSSIEKLERFGDLMQMVVI
jgi:2-methylcitrate dehydratase